MAVAVMPVTPAPRLTYSKDAPVSAKPFWKAKPELLEKMATNREIVVSVHRSDTKDGKVLFTMLGAGDVARDKETCVRLAQDYPQLKTVSDHFKTVTYDPKEQKLFVITEALGYQARMLLKLTPVHEDWRSEIQFEVIWGSFKGMKGVIGFEKLAPRLTEVSFSGRLETADLPIPKFLMGLALETITRQVAEKMRSAIEARSL